MILWQNVIFLQFFMNIVALRKSIYICVICIHVFGDDCIKTFFAKTIFAQWSSFSSNLKPLFACLFVLAVFHEGYLS